MSILRRFITVVTLTFLILIPLQLPRTYTKPTNINRQIVLPDNFNKVYNSFHSYNNNTDTSLVITFCNVAHLYGLDKDTLEFEWLMGQVLLESGAQQYRSNGKLVTSNTGAVGFGQILRSTSILYLKKCITSRDSSIFKFIGVTDYSFIHNDDYDRRERIDMARLWLSNEKNNIAMWGKIMSDELRHKTMTKALISYNVGPRGLREYIDSGCVLANHDYIVGIRRRMSHVK